MLGLHGVSDFWLYLGPDLDVINTLGVTKQLEGLCVSLALACPALPFKYIHIFKIFFSAGE